MTPNVNENALAAKDPAEALRDAVMQLAVPPEQSQTQAVEVVKPLSNGEILEMQFPATPYLVDGLISAGALCLIGADPKCFKSWLMMHLGLAHSSPDVHEVKWLGRFKLPENRGKVVYVADTCECSLREYQRRITKLGSTGREDMYLLTPEMCKVPRLTLTDQHVFDLLRRSLDELKLTEYDLVVFDSLVRFAGGDENAASDSDRLMRSLRALTPATKVAVHHLRKSSAIDVQAGIMSRIRGSVDILAAVDTAITLHRVSQGSNSVQADVISRHGEPLDPFLIEMTEANGRITFACSEDTPERNCRTEVLKVIEARGPICVKDIAEACESRGYSTSAVNQALAKLKNEKAVRFERKGNEHLYRLVAKEVSDEGGSGDQTASPSSEGAAMCELPEDQEAVDEV